MNEDILNELKKSNRMLYALLAITVDQHIRGTDLAKPRPRSIDRMLTDVGLTGVEIAKLLGKTPQAVSNALAGDGKTSTKKTKSAKKSHTTVSVDEGEKV
jgi:hypothetical protein